MLFINMTMESEVQCCMYDALLCFRKLRIHVRMQLYEVTLFPWFLGQEIFSNKHVISCTSVIISTRKVLLQKCVAYYVG